VKKRIAYIGLSCPVLYDYRNFAKKTSNDVSSSPNPILEAPFGLMLLYDELWFLCGSLCPNNMRNLHFVKFIDKMFPSLDFESIEAYEQSVATKDIDMFKYLPYDKLIGQLNLDRKIYLPDNHSHSIKVGNIQRAGKSTLMNLEFDLNVIFVLKNILGQDSVELITNSYTSRMMGNISNAQNLLVEAITIENIPNYMTTSGPYHEVIDEAREDKYLKYFRKWIIDEHKDLSKKSIKDIKEEVENAIQEKQKHLFLKSLDLSTHYKSIGEALLMNTVGDLLPVVPLAKDIFTASRAIKEIMSNKCNLWQGFVVNSKNWRR
jgi:hypothetical protein